MSIQTKIEDTRKPDYPYLAKNIEDGYIVLLVSKDKGIDLSNPTGILTFLESTLEVFHGSVTFTNNKGAMVFSGWNKPTAEERKQACLEDFIQQAVQAGLKIEKVGTSEKTGIQLSPAELPKGPPESASACTEPPPPKKCKVKVDDRFWKFRDGYPPINEDVQLFDNEGRVSLRGECWSQQRNDHKFKFKRHGMGESDIRDIKVTTCFWEYSHLFWQQNGTPNPFYRRESK